jgi:hypothetical protein
VLRTGADFFERAAVGLLLRGDEAVEIMGGHDCETREAGWGSAPFSSIGTWLVRRMFYIKKMFAESTFAVTFRGFAKFVAQIAF